MKKPKVTHGVLIVVLTLLSTAGLYAQEQPAAVEQEVLQESIHEHLLAEGAGHPAPARLSAQQEQQLPDTSYFKPGEDDWNLLESVIRNNPVNTALLLERGADPDAVSAIGNTALMYAAEKGNMQIMKMLVAAGAEVNTTGFNGATPLFLAILNNDFQATKYLLEQGADPNVKDDFGVTPLLYTAATNQYQSADLLLFHDADPEVRDAEGNDPLMAAVTFENLETSDVLLQNGLDPDTRDHRNNTPLIVGTQRGNYSIMDLLLDYEADANLANRKNYTPLAYAVTYGDLKASGMLIDNGADVEHVIEKGRNIAELARINGNDSLLQLIMDHGGEVPQGPDFSEFRVLFGNSFNTSDYFIQFRGNVVDTKKGYFFGTGIDYRPFLLKIQTIVNDSIFQFRERRIGWSHTIGRNFSLFETTSGTQFSLYTALNGYLSFPRYPGTIKDPGATYRVIPSAGFDVHGKYLGLKAGADWYHFESTLDKPLKFSLSVFFRIEYPEVHYDRKEINWE
ncbi:MAG: ankyrin repeat domain-containing protein [Bacteroidales bacterium]|nr:ankyrin repeat domain-containing protein [Bacteroidales bacterium]MDT8429977.1 ankyrin repeat domain-containing protein [Bacteroidales bacterium]